MKKNAPALSILLLLVSWSGIAAQTTPTLEEQLTSFWIQKKHAELQILLDAKTSSNPPDVVAAYCAKFFYVFVQPNKVKALAAVNKLKAAAEATTDSDFIAFANGELAEVEGIPDAEFVQSTPAILAAIHADFPDKYPNIALGVRLRRYKHP